MTDALAPVGPVAAVARIRAELEAAVDPTRACFEFLAQPEHAEEYAAAAASAAEIEVTDEATLEIADAAMKVILREMDRVEAFRKSGPGALDSIVRALNAKFKPLRDTLETAVRNLKYEIGKYQVAQRKAQEEAYRAAAEAHAAGEHAAAQAALVIASDAAVIAPAGTTVREVWEVERINRDLMTPEWLIPDMPRIEKLARETPAGERPIVPGVIFKLVPRVTARR